MKACESCGCFAAECLTPVGDGAADLCWFCAHDTTHHGAKLGEVSKGCSCKREEIYPPDVIAKMRGASRAFPLRDIAGEIDRGELHALTRGPHAHRTPYDGRREARRERIARVQLHGPGKHSAGN